MKTSYFKVVFCLQLMGFLGPVNAQSRKSLGAAQGTSKATGALLDPAAVFERPRLSSKHFLAQLSLGTHVAFRGSMDLRLAAGYEWTYLSLLTGYRFKSGTYSSLRSRPNLFGSEIDTAGYPEELARERADGDAWTLGLFDFIAGAKGPLLLSTNSNLYQRASFALSFGAANDKNNELKFASKGYSLGAFLGYQIQKRIAIEAGLELNWVEGTRREPAGAKIDRKLPLNWYSMLIGTQFYF